MRTFEELTGIIRDAGEDEDNARITQGEAAALVQVEHGRGGLKEAAKDAHAPYKTVAERARIVNYYQQLYQNLLGRNTLDVGDSCIRDLMAEFPVLRWTYFRVAKGLDKHNPWEALNALRLAVETGMTDAQFKRYVAKRKGKPPRYVIPGPAGWTTTISKDD